MPSWRWTVRKLMGPLPLPNWENCSGWLCLRWRRVGRVKRTAFWNKSDSPAYYVLSFTAVIWLKSKMPHRSAVVFGFDLIVIYSSNLPLLISGLYFAVDALCAVPRLPADESSEVSALSCVFGKWKIIESSKLTKLSFYYRAIHWFIDYRKQSGEFRKDGIHSDYARVPAASSSQTPSSFFSHL